MHPYAERNLRLSSNRFQGLFEENYQFLHFALEFQEFPQHPYELYDHVLKPDGLPMLLQLFGIYQHVEEPFHYGVIPSFQVLHG